MWQASKAPLCISRAIMPLVGCARKLECTVWYASRLLIQVAAAIPLLPLCFYHLKLTTMCRLILTLASGALIPIVLRVREGSTRSEEHTSELQSRFDVVGRLLVGNNSGRCDARGG